MGCKVPSAAVRRVLVCAAVLTALAPAAARAAEAPFQAGAARVVTNPPGYSAAASDDLYGATCPSDGRPSTLRRHV